MNQSATLGFVIIFATVVALTSAPVPAVAQTAAPAETSAESLIEAARAALANGAPDDAEFLLDGVKPGEGDIDDLDFLYGSIGLLRGDWDAAIARFRAMLARNPDLPRVRLDLALAYFQARKDTGAAYHFRLALGAKGLPPAARARALGFLDLIRRRKSWSVTGLVALAPDSNINAATSARRVDLFGLPAQLSEDARRTSGVGLSASVSGGYESRLSPDTRFLTSAGLSTRTYREGQFNEQVLTLGAGPRFLFSEFDLRPEVTARLRRLGGDMYSRAAGVDVSTNWAIAPEWRLSASAGAERIFYAGFLGDGHIYSAQLGVVHFLGKATLVQGDVSFRREVLDDKSYSWSERIFGVSAVREFPKGFVLTVGPSFRWREYGAPLPVFGPDARKDRTVAGRISVSNRQLELFGFMPEVTLRLERRRSNIDLYDYTRTVGEIGLVRSF